MSFRLDRSCGNRAWAPRQPLPLNSSGLISIARCTPPAVGNAQHLPPTSELPGSIHLSRTSAVTRHINHKGRTLQGRMMYEVRNGRDETVSTDRINGNNEESRGTYAGQAGAPRTLSELEDHASDCAIETLARLARANRSTPSLRLVV